MSLAIRSRSAMQTASMFSTLASSRSQARARRSVSSQSAGMFFRERTAAERYLNPCLFDRLET